LEKPEQFNKLRQKYVDRDPSLPPLIYIIKRPGLARGYGVHLAGSLADIDAMTREGSVAFPLNKTYPLAQKYIEDVLTLEGHKVTLRVYVLITSFDPLRLYVYHNGLVRICSRKYSLDPKHFSDNFVHVDSIDINEVNEHEFEISVANSTLQHEGLRCDIKYLLSKLESEGHNSTQLWENINDLVVKSIAAAERKMLGEVVMLTQTNRTRRAYPWEMTGYDILIDKNMKPYLLEINNTPSMSPHTVIENKIKQSLLHDLLDVVDAENKEWKKVGEVVDQKWAIFDRLPKGYMLPCPISGKTFNTSLVKSKGALWPIVETEIEYARSIPGGFKRVFPTPHVGDKYVKYLTNPRNLMVQEWLNSGCNIDSIVPINVSPPNLPPTNEILTSS